MHKNGTLWATQVGLHQVQFQGWLVGGGGVSVHISHEISYFDDSSSTEGYLQYTYCKAEP